jgi:tetratricopeptide (TPR) repeat protein
VSVQELASLKEKAKNLFESGQFDKAKYILNEIVDIDSEDSHSFYYLGNIFHMNGEIGKAIKAFNQALKINPAHTDSAIALSVLYNDIGKYDQAKKIFKETSKRVKRTGSSSQNVEDLHINKKFSQKHLELADMYVSYNRYDESLFEYDKAIGLDKENLNLRIKLAKVYAKKGLNSKAMEELSRLKNEHPEFLEARVSLGVLHFTTGNTLKAQTEWEAVLARNPRHEKAGMYLNLSKAATETVL